MWQMNSDTDDPTAAQYISYFTEVFDAHHDTIPGIQIGCFGIMPVQPIGANTAADLKTLNTRAAPIAAAADYIAPDLYLTTDNWPTRYGGVQAATPTREANFRLYAENVAAYAKQYNKPVYVFICPQYINDALAFPFIDGAYWKTILETCYQLLDGVILWGGYDLVNQIPPKSVPWDEQAAWWQQTKDFIIKYNLEPLG